MLLKGIHNVVVAVVVVVFAGFIAYAMRKKIEKRVWNVLQQKVIY